VTFDGACSTLRRALSQQQDARDRHERELVRRALPG
jgi:hypothetical protein